MNKFDVKFKEVNLIYDEDHSSMVISKNLYTRSQAAKHFSEALGKHVPENLLEVTNMKYGFFSSFDPDSSPGWHTVEQSKKGTQEAWWLSPEKEMKCLNL